MHRAGSSQAEHQTPVRADRTVAGQLLPGEAGGWGDCGELGANVVDRRGVYPSSVLPEKARLPDDDRQ